MSSAQGDQVLLTISTWNFYRTVGSFQYLIAPLSLGHSLISDSFIVSSSLEFEVTLKYFSDIFMASFSLAASDDSTFLQTSYTSKDKKKVYSKDSVCLHLYIIVPFWNTCIGGRKSLSCMLIDKFPRVYGRGSRVQPCIRFGTCRVSCLQNSWLHFPLGFPSS